MSDLLEDIDQIINGLDDLFQEGIEKEIPKKLEQLKRATNAVGESSSKSWIGYHAFLYIKDFQTPDRADYFDASWGLRRDTEASPFNMTKGRWEEYDQERVCQEILRRTGLPDRNDLWTFSQKAKSKFQRGQTNLLSIIDIKQSEGNSQFLLRLKTELEVLSIRSAEEIRAEWIPEKLTTQDLGAIQQGLKSPPHVDFLAQVQSDQEALEAVQSLYQIARQAKTHISRQEFNHQLAIPPGTRVFIGHGRSPVWRDLKDFLQERLGLETDEFNRVSAAGMPTTRRMSDMMSTAGIAFLIMTGEDEQADGTIRARENVVHEAGLFQGHLGFERAIVLLEEGCQEFSNIIGLGQIRFPAEGIAPAFEEIRKVLEREGFIGQ